MNEYEKLIEKRNAKLDEIRKMDKKINEIEEEVLRPEYEKKYVGRYFKYRNSYGGSKPNEHWWLYKKIVEVEYINFTNEPTFKCVYFQKDFRGKIEIEFDRLSYISTLGNEITKEEFDKALNQIKKSINKIE